MPLFRFTADAGDWFKFPPEHENMEGHTGPWMAFTTRKENTEPTLPGNVHTRWHVKFSREGIETTMMSNDIMKYKCPEVIELDDLDPTEVEFMRSMGVKGLPEFGRAKRHAAKKPASPAEPEPKRQKNKKSTKPSSSSAGPTAWHAK